MKKTYLFFIFVTIISITQAQITINSENLVGEGDVVINSHDPNPIGLSIGVGGPSQAWDFSSLEQLELDTLYFESPTDLTGFSSFAQSNLGLLESESDSSWTFVTKNSSGFFLDGFVELTEDGLESFAANQTIITFPSTMGTTFLDSSYLLIGVIPLGVDLDGPGPLEIIDSIKITRSTNVSSTIDGWGDLTTPSGVFPTLKQIVLEQTIDTTWSASGGSGVWQVMGEDIGDALNFSPIIIESNRTARWWTNDSKVGFPLLEMEYEDGGAVTSLSWNVLEESLGISSQDFLEKKVNIYPNPAKNQITIETEFKNNNRLQWIDITGRVVLSESFTKDKIYLTTESLKNGLYFCQILDDKGQVLKTKKFVIAK